MKQLTCRFCRADLKVTFCNLGASPLSNAFLTAEEVERPETFYPLHARVCERCFLVQVEEFEAPQGIFNANYAYFSSYSDSWLDHCRAYVDRMIERFSLGPASQVVEVALNDGYLLQYFVRRGIPVLGIDPAANCAAEAERKGVPTLVGFFGTETAGRLVQQGKQAKLLAGNNVLAHVPDLNDFVAGLKLLLAKDGILTMEFPHLLSLIEGHQFDTIYHEHFSYFSFLTVEQVFARHGIALFDVELLPTHGGSLRIYGRHAENVRLETTAAVAALRAREAAARLDAIDTYRGFESRVRATKRSLLKFLIDAAERGKKVAAFGAPAKGNTLLNFCGVRDDFIEFATDRNPHKQGRFLPGTHVPIRPPSAIGEARPDYVLILPWNLESEAARELAYVREWGGKLVIPVPEVRILP